VNSFSSIVDSKDYLGCINGNCSKINCESKSNSNSKTQDNINQEQQPNSKTNFVSKLVEFLFMLFITASMVFILYTRSSQYLLYVLGITILFIFYKIYIGN